MANQQKDWSRKQMQEGYLQDLTAVVWGEMISGNRKMAKGRKREGM